MYHIHFLHCPCLYTPGKSITKINQVDIIVTVIKMINMTVL